MIRFLTTAILCIISAGCNNNKSAIVDNRISAYEVISSSTNNKAELEKVILHYQDIGDSAKVQAAYYLIANMPGKQSVMPANNDEFEDIHSKLTAGRLKPVVLEDLENIKADYLIRNIDQAFDQWKKTPWHADYSFEEFCEYVLPYRVTTEPPEDWRSIALSNPLRAEDSLLQYGDQIALTKALILGHYFEHSYETGEYPFAFTFTEMNSLRSGSCALQAYFGVQLMRSRGIPCAADLVPVWANRHSDHIWMSVILPEGEKWDFGYGWDFKNTMPYKISKIYRMTYSVDYDDLLFKNRNIEFVPTFFKNFNLKDVTSEYGMPMSNFTIEVPESRGAKLAWLCTFDNVAWQPVAYAPVEKKKAKFENIGRGVLWISNKYQEFTVNTGDGIAYLPACFENSKLVPQGNPFALHEDGSIEEFIPDYGNMQTLTLKRKYPKRQYFIDNEKNLIGSRFEGANRSDFKDAELIMIVTGHNDGLLKNIEVANPRKYRYIRFIPTSDTVTKVAEIKVFSDSIELKGKVLCNKADRLESSLQVFDDNTLSWHLVNPPGEKSPTIEWFGLDFGTKQEITSIAFAPHTDDNEIIPGEKYQLRYWDNGWKTTPERIADDYYMTWENVPSGALFWLRNLTKGKEERIFTYENGKQVWW